MKAGVQKDVGGGNRDRGVGSDGVLGLVNRGVTVTSEAQSITSVARVRRRDGLRVYGRHSRKQQERQDLDRRHDERYAAAMKSERERRVKNQGRKRRARCMNETEKEKDARLMKKYSTRDGSSYTSDDQGRSIDLITANYLPSGVGYDAPQLGCSKTSGGQSYAPLYMCGWEIIGYLA